MTGPVTSSAQTPEPTDEQRAVAESLFPRHVGRCSWDWHYGPDGPGCSCGMEENRDRIARALAAAVTAEREKAETVAQEIETDMARSGMSLVSGPHFARRIREVSR